MRPRRWGSYITSTLLLGGLMVALPQAAHAKDLTKLSLDEVMSLDEIQVTVPGAHFHRKGDYMVGVTASQTNWVGLQSGTQSVDPNTLLRDGFGSAELNMNMEMEMIMLMYGVRDDWTVQVMIPEMQMSMAMVQAPQNSNTNFNMTVAGLGDIAVGVIHPLKYHYPGEFQVELNLGLPTGSINQFSNIPTLGPTKDPYNMQLGAGALSLQPALTYLGQTNKLSYGGQLKAFLPLAGNSDGWEAPNQFVATAWVAKYVNKRFTPSLRVDYETQSAIRGIDPQIPEPSQASSVPSSYIGNRADVFVGSNFALQQDGHGHGVWVSLEAGWPIWQNLVGPQLHWQNQYNAAFQWTFK